VNDILFERRGAAGVIVLNRPQALNALTHAMVRAMTSKLAEWADDAAVTRVLVTAAGGRAFCAGGDVRELYDLGRAGRHDEALRFLHDEYRLDAAIAHYRKPYISLIDGAAMGGGVGISIHGSHRVAGDGLRFAMPEVGIGFFPDVGATWFLPRLPGEVGTWLALTGETLGAADATAFGIATHRVRSTRLPELAQALCGNVAADAVLGAFAEPIVPGPVAARRAAMDRLFAADTVEEIVAALAAETAGADASFAGDALAAIRRKSPTSLKIALAQLRRGRTLDFEACMQTEFRIVSRIVRGHDFYEGIRAVIVDKDRNPRWSPASLDAVSEADVEAYFAPLPTELALR
jgi:enoyl-CoA hydratase